MPLTQETLHALAAAGQDGRHQFRENIIDAAALAADMASLANSAGGVILAGAAGDGSLPGLSPEDVRRTGQLVDRAAGELVRGPLSVRTECVRLDSGRAVLALTVPRSADRPHFDGSGIVWRQEGARRRPVTSREELLGLLADAAPGGADEQPSRAGMDLLDRTLLGEFLRACRGESMPRSERALRRLLEDMNLVTDTGRLNLACALMFTRHPEWSAPQRTVRVLNVPDSGDLPAGPVDFAEFRGPLLAQCEGALAFVLDRLRPADSLTAAPAIPPEVIEELLVNALVHRDYAVCAPIRILVRETRVDIISPGHLPGGLTVFGMRCGCSRIRNSVLASYAAMGLLPFRGCGSGIRRSLEAWPAIDFASSAEDGLFTVSVRRKSV